VYTDHSYISTQKPAILLRSRSRKFGRFFRTILSVVKDAGRNLVDDTRKADKRDDGKDADQSTSCVFLSLAVDPVKVPGMFASRAWTLVPPSSFAFHQWLVAHNRHDTDRSKSGKIKGTCTCLGQINATAFNIGPSVRDRDRDGTTIPLVGDLDFGTKGQ
jgi:hypothetical protein